MVEFKNLVEVAAKQYPDKAAVIFDDQKINYQTLEQLVEQMANYFLKNGISSGQEILVMMDNSIELVVVLLAIFKIEARAFILPPSLKPEEFLKITKPNNIDAVIVLTKLSSEGIDFLKTLSLRVITCNYDGQLNLAVWPGGNTVGSTTTGGEFVLRMVSSGSTGEVKQMLRTADSLVAMCEAVEDFFQVDEKEIFLNFVPPSHIMGVGQIILAIYFKATLVLEKAFVPAKIVADIEKYQVTWMMSSPFVLNVLATAADPAKNSFSFMKHAISASAPLTQSVYDNFRSRCRAALHEVYGSTESTIVTAELDDGVFKPNVVGRPVKGVKIKIVDDNFKELPPDTVGHIATASPMTVLRYENNLSATQASFMDGYVLVGDRGFIDKLGQLHVVGRTNDVINVAGKKVDPVEVEQVIVTYPGVKEVAVYGIDVNATQAVAAAVVKSADIVPEELKKYCQSKLSDYKIPREIKFIEALPRNATGKLMRQQLKNV